MARLRLFANLRESAGTSRAEFDGSTAGDVIDAASTRYGVAFSAGLGTAKIWVNGDPADRSTPVGPGDEIALIPPVSGGALAARRQVDLLALSMPVALATTLLAANVQTAEIFAFAVVGVGLLWMWDLSEVLSSQRRTVNMIPPMIAMTAAVNGAYGWGRMGLVGGLIVGLIITLGWTTLDPGQRSVHQVAVSTTVAMVGGLGAGLLMIIRLNSQVEVVAFVVVALVGGGLAALVTGDGPLPIGMDPNLATFIGGVLGGIAAGVVSTTADYRRFALAAALTVGGMIAGRALGSLVRTGQVIHTSRTPGLVTGVDAATLGVAAWWLGLLLFGA